eukprot:TRINITY_DN11802_c0_g5_i1.p1 TRINITY_DN11802_c0_g5~~TRINITY_DN11802_c0_g5_i1.p1  ORF type:complete len:142 (+),score=31.66 TRINITY_DN11802_c0_g5_i1:101-526(+)
MRGSSMREMLRRFHGNPPTSEEARQPCPDLWWQRHDAGEMVDIPGRLTEVQQHLGKLLLDESLIAPPLYQQCAVEGEVLRRVEALESEFRGLKQQLAGHAVSTPGEDQGTHPHPHPHEEHEDWGSTDKMPEQDSALMHRQA